MQVNTRDPKQGFYLTSLNVELQILNVSIFEVPTENLIKKKKNANLHLSMQHHKNTYSKSLLCVYKLKLANSE